MAKLGLCSCMGQVPSLACSLLLVHVCQTTDIRNKGLLKPVSLYQRTRKATCRATFMRQRGTKQLKFPRCLPWALLILRDSSHLSSAAPQSCSVPPETWKELFAQVQLLTQDSRCSPGRRHFLN